MESSNRKDTEEDQVPKNDIEMKMFESILNEMHGQRRTFLASKFLDIQKNLQR